MSSRVIRTSTEWEHVGDSHFTVSPTVPRAGFGPRGEFERGERGVTSTRHALQFEFVRVARLLPKIRASDPNVTRLVPGTPSAPVKTGME